MRGRSHAACRFLYARLVKTTLNIRDDLLAEAKAAAVRNRTTLTRLVEEGLALRLRTTRSVSAAALAELPSTLVVLGIALLWVMLSGRRGGR